MKAEQLFDLIEDLIQSAADTSSDPMYVYMERDMRGTFPALQIRVMPVPRQKKPKPGAKVISPRPHA